MSTKCMWRSVCLYLSLFLQWSALRSYGKKPGHSSLAQSLLSISGADCLCLETEEVLYFFNKGFFSTEAIPADMTSNSSLSNMRRLVEQLKLEASVERIKVKENPLKPTTLKNVGVYRLCFIYLVVICLQSVTN